MLVVAHRAGNSLAELREAFEAGVDMVEADVRYYRGVLEVRHLKTLGPRLLWDHPWELVRRRAISGDAGFPTLDAVLRSLDGEGQMMLDLKGARRGAGGDLASAVSHLLRRVSPAAQIAVCARQWRLLDAFTGDPPVRLVLSAGNRRELRSLLALVGCEPKTWPGGRRAFGVAVRRPLLTPEVVRELHRGVSRVLTWPVDTAAHLDDARRLGVSGIIGKDLALLREVARRN